MILKNIVQKNVDSNAPNKSDCRGLPVTVKRVDIILDIAIYLWIICIKI